MSNLPNVLILGGCGFIARNFVRFLIEENLVGHITVADKVLVDIAGLSEDELALYKGDLVSFKQSNLANPERIDEVFEVANEFGNVDFIFNLCGATKYSQAPEIYDENIIQVANTVSQAAVRHNVGRWIEVSTAQVYKPKKESSDENGRIAPWTGVAQARLEAENIIQNSGLDFVILRPAIVYGPGDTLGLTPKLVIGSIYKSTGDTMKLLWSKKLKTNTVHVLDVARAMWHVKDQVPSGSIFNLADEADSDQGSINRLLEELYGIRTGFVGETKSKMAARVSMKMLTDLANDKHLKPWSDLCKDNGILDSPLTPYLDEELLYDKHIAIDGSAITGSGFNYAHPQPTVDLLREVLDDFVAKGVFPAAVLN